MVATEKHSDNVPSTVSIMNDAMAAKCVAETPYATKVQRNANLAQCERELFFQEVRRKLAEYRTTHPNANIIDLSVGDASEPIPKVITSAMEQYAHGLSTLDGFSGYGSYQGVEPLRKRISEVLYSGLAVQPQEIFVSDGAKGSFARLQILFGPHATVAVQDPSYPVVPELCKLIGPGSSFPEGDSKVVYIKSRPEEDFFLDLMSAKRTDVIYFCSPNNPTGVAATREQLQELVDFAKRNGSVIIYDAVYSCFMTDNCPKSIYEIPGAREVAIEVGSFSKFAGFTGVRLGWSVIPESLLFSDGRPVIKDFHRVVLLTFAAGPSNVVQAGGLACLTPEGLQALQCNIEYYKENAKILLEVVASLGLKVLGGRNCPYLWVEFPGWSSSAICSELLKQLSILTTPGNLFGPSGEGYIRISAFGHRERILETAERLKKLKF